MFEGTAEALKQTKVTQPAIFLHSTILAKLLGNSFQPEMVAGHSLGEISALTAAGVLSFEDGLKLVSKRALAMQAACEAEPSSMAAILGLENEVVEEICANCKGIVVAANYNCPGQLVISGNTDAVNDACEKLKDAGAPRPRREGKGEGSWVLLDFIDLVVHVQLPEARSTYDLERLWRDQPQLALPDSIAEL